MTSTYCCIKCVGLLPPPFKVKFTYSECDCSITSDDYDAYEYSRNIDCLCDETEDMCDVCNKGSYAVHEVESNEVCINCIVCKKEEKSCCHMGYHEICTY